MDRRHATGALVVAAALVAGLGFGGYQLNARHKLEGRAHALTGGNPRAGREAIARRPCGGCHQIPGVPGAAGTVGPSLAGFSGRLYIGGRLQNTPDNLVSWIENPHNTDPQNVMPPMGIGEPEARDIAAYLYTLR